MAEISVQSTCGGSLDLTWISIQFIFDESLDLTKASNKPERHIE